MRLPICFLHEPNRTRTRDSRDQEVREVMTRTIEPFSVVDEINGRCQILITAEQGNWDGISQ